MKPHSILTKKYYILPPQGDIVEKFSSVGGGGGQILDTFSKTLHHFHYYGKNLSPQGGTCCAIILRRVTISGPFSETKHHRQ